MKKSNVISLIKYYSEDNHSGFRSTAADIATEFSNMGDDDLAQYIMALLSDANTFVAQDYENHYHFLKKIELDSLGLWLPDAISDDIKGIVNAVSHNLGVNKFLFQGKPGTGKTEAAKQLSRILNRDLFAVDFSLLIDSKLGQTQKNIMELFSEIESIAFPEKVMVLFDELDALALDRTNTNDHREMGRATSTLLKAIDDMSEKIVLIATTNLFSYFDKAIIRRFDYVVDFNRYTTNELLEISERILNGYLKNLKMANKDIKLFKKILKLQNPMPCPGELKNIIKTAVAFSDINDGADYFRKLYKIINGTIPNNLQVYKEQGFTVREIEILTKIPKSSVARELNDKK